MFFFLLCFLFDFDRIFCSRFWTCFSFLYFCFCFIFILLLLFIKCLARLMFYFYFYFITFNYYVWSKIGTAVGRALKPPSYIVYSIQHTHILSFPSHNSCCCACVFSLFFYFSLVLPLLLPLSLSLHLSRFE